jgi:hypothetical protein
MGAEFLILVFVIFGMGAFIVTVVLASFAYRHEDRRGSLHAKAPGIVCRGARRLTGVGTIGPAGWILQPRPGTDDTVPMDSYKE